MTFFVHPTGKIELWGYQYDDDGDIVGQQFTRPHEVYEYTCFEEAREDSRSLTQTTDQQWTVSNWDPRIFWPITPTKRATLPSWWHDDGNGHIFINGD